MRHQESWSQSFDRDNTSDINDENQLALESLARLVSTTSLNEAKVASALVNYEKSAQNVRDRWELYKHAENYVDIQSVSLEAAAVPFEGTLLDVGTADGKYLYDIATAYSRPDIMLFGLELMEAQLDHSRFWQRISQDIFTSYDEQPRLFADMIAGSAEDLSMFPDASLDAVTAMFMMYHLPNNARNAMLSECSRVLNPEGRLVISTSGVYNKKLHRLHEKIIARHMNQPNNGRFEPPRTMNADFVSESSTQEMRMFKTVYGYEYHDKIVLDSEEKCAAYEKSLRSMYDQFDPIPPTDLFDAAISAVMYDIERAADIREPYEETVQRQVLVCSNGPISQKSLPAGFKRRYFKAKSVL